MGGRRLVPLTLLGVMSLLTGGAIAWGLLAGPAPASVAVGNATDATYGSPLGTTSFVLDLASSVSSGGTNGFISQTRRISYVPTNDMVVYQTQPSVKRLGRVPPAGITKTLTQYGAVTGGPIAWSNSGSAMTRTEPFSTFSARVTPGQPAVKDGTVHETAFVRGGYLVMVKLKVVVPSQSLGNGQVAAGGVVNETYRLLRINGHKAPALTP